MTSRIEKNSVKKRKRRGNASEDFEKASQKKDPRFRLRLFVTGTTPRSVDAITNINRFCQEHLRNYELEIIDIYQQPELAREEQIIAVPTLIKKLPLPLRKFIGDFTDKERMLTGLNLKAMD